MGTVSKEHEKALIKTVAVVFFITVLPSAFVVVSSYIEGGVDTQPNATLLWYFVPLIAFFASVAIFGYRKNWESLWICSGFICVFFGALLYVDFVVSSTIAAYMTEGIGIAILRFFLVSIFLGGLFLGVFCFTFSIAWRELRDGKDVWNL